MPTMYMDETSRLVRVNGPASEPVTLAEAKQYLRIEHTADDAVIAHAISAAREAAEEYMRVAMLPQSFSYTAPLAGTIITLPIGPAQTIASIQLYGSDGSSSVVSPSYYRLTIDGYGVVFNHSPTGVKVMVHYEAYSASNAANVSILMKQGLLQHIAVMVEERGGYTPLPKASLASYQPFRRVRL